MANSAAWAQGARSAKAKYPQIGATELSGVVNRQGAGFRQPMKHFFISGARWVIGRAVRMGWFATAGAAGRYGSS